MLDPAVVKWEDVTDFSEENILKKIVAAKTQLDFQNANQNHLNRKCRALGHILMYVNKLKENNHIPSEDLIAEIMEMCRANILRPLPWRPERSCLDPLGEAQAPYESAWEPLRLSYLIFQGLVTLEGSELLIRAYLPLEFIRQLIEVFDSHDLRERDRLKVLMHRIYCQIPTRRPFIRKKISEILIRHVYEEDVVGVDELLQLYGCIAGGLSVPLNDEHKVFLEKVLLPLHKSEDLARFHRHLVFCIAQFLYKDSSLTHIVFHSLLFKYWPKTSAPKETLFIQEVQDYLQIIDPEDFKTIQDSLFSQLAKCLMSPSSQVTQGVLALWKNHRILSLITMNMHAIMPTVFPALYAVRKEQWNTTTSNKIYRVFEWLWNSDRQLFEDMVAACREVIVRELGEMDHSEDTVFFGVEPL